MGKGKYDHTLNLPRPFLPMRAGLTKREPDRVKKWENMNIYQRMIEARKGAKVFILHDGPPYANGNIHLGHALNKVLKDITVKYRFLKGNKVLYVPGWDTHGLPIENAVKKKTGKTYEEMDPVQWRAECKKIAEHFIKIQLESFKRLGVFGDWNNFYATFQPHYEAKEIEVLTKFVEDGYIIREHKPVYWCPHCKTALADAEIEYKEKVSHSIFVSFDPIDGGFAPVIWTTTPWTLPANVALAVHPEEYYVKVRVDDRIFLIAEKRLSDVAETIGWTDYEIVDRVVGSDLEGVKVRHPVYEDKESIIVTANFVSMEEGTGIVHIAPGHGAEDHQLAVEKGLPIVMFIDNEGVYEAEAGFLAGIFYNEANKIILDLLKEKNRLLYAGSVKHSYPHCWRCHNPIIFRAIEQWFIDVNKYKELAIKSLEEVNWYPSHSINRIRSMIEVRPNWCLSRQRLWGVPIPAVKCKDCGYTFLDPRIMRKFIEYVKEEGTDAWFTHDIKDFVPEGVKCPKCGGIHFEKTYEVLDVWFDSGVSHAAVLEQWPEHTHPADLYLEGYDQHRGWFQTSLLTSIPYKGHPPYKAVLSHGFTLDEQGRPMSKSLGNGVDPIEVSNKYGADILRYALAMLDYTSDIMFGETVLKGAVDAYRKLRNTFRFIEGNLYDFDKSGIVPFEDMLPLDRWILWKFFDQVGRIIKSYDEYEYYNVHSILLPFVSRVLSAVYLDAVKSRLYLRPSRSLPRRSAQTALYYIGKVFAQILAPIIPFTAEDMWDALRDKGFVDEESIFLSKLNFDKFDISNEEKEAMEIALSIREKSNEQIEKLRSQKVLGHNLDAFVKVWLPPREKELIDVTHIDLEELLIVSGVEVLTGDELAVEVSKAIGHKCPRCWKVKMNIGEDLEYPDLCLECATDLRQLSK